MEIPLIDKKIRQLIKKYDTRDPFKIAREKNIVVLEEDLGELYGYYNRLHNVRFLHINQNIDDRMKLVTCAHELGHAICHPHENTPKLSKFSMTSELKIETEANYFATNLIVENEYIEQESFSSYDVLKYYGIPSSMERYLKKPSTLQRR